MILVVYGTLCPVFFSRVYEVDWIMVLFVFQYDWKGTVITEHSKEMPRLRMFRSVTPWVTVDRVCVSTIMKLIEAVAQVPTGYVCPLQKPKLFWLANHMYRCNLFCNICTFFWLWTFLWLNWLTTDAQNDGILIVSDARMPWRYWARTMILMEIPLHPPGSVYQCILSVTTLSSSPNQYSY